MAEYSCNTGYLPSGTLSRQCMSDGEWSGNAPSCISKLCSHVYVIGFNAIMNQYNIMYLNLAFS